jgi:hypothetical protein
VWEGGKMNPGERVRIEYIRPGKEVTYYEEEFFAQDESCLRTFKTLPEDISVHLSNALLSQNLIVPGQRVGTIAKLYFFNEPFNLLIFRAANGWNLIRDITLILANPSSNSPPTNSK